VGEKTLQGIIGIVISPGLFADRDPGGSIESRKLKKRALQAMKGEEDGNNLL
jgi:hypothetical protein